VALGFPSIDLRLRSFDACGRIAAC
jgi:hypothetical protein